jgi:hypothetical protein
MGDLIPLSRHDLLFFPSLSRAKIIGGKRFFSRFLAVPHFCTAVKLTGFLSPGVTLPLIPASGENSEKLIFASAGRGENFNERNEWQD